MIGITRFRHFKKSGARIYISQHLISSSDFPFEEGELLKVEFCMKRDALIISKPEWWELLNWELMPDGYEKLPQEIKDKIQSSASTTKS